MMRVPTEKELRLIQNYMALGDIVIGFGYTKKGDCNIWVIENE